MISTGKKQFYAQFCGRFSKASFDAPLEMHLSKRLISIIEKKNLGKFNSGLNFLTSTDEEQFYVLLYVWFPAIAIFLRAVKDRDAFVIE